MDRLAELLPDGALDAAVKGLRPEELSGPGGLLSQLAGRVVEAALEAEMTEHLGQSRAPRRPRPTSAAARHRRPSTAISGRCRSAHRATAKARLGPSSL